MEEYSTKEIYEKDDVKKEYLREEHKGIVKRHRQNLVRFCHKFPRLYGFTYLISLFSLIILLAFADVSVKALTYPVFYQMEEASGVIDASWEKEVDVFIKRKESSFKWYYYTIDGLDIPVNASHMRNYDEGDVMPYYRYERNGKVAGEIIKYTPIKGIIIFVVDVLVIINAIFFVSTSTTTDKNKLVKDAEETRRYKHSQQKGNRAWIPLLVFMILVLVAAVVSFAVACRGILITMM